MKKLTTQYLYKVVKSKQAENYFYIIEIIKDEFGTTSDVITKPLTAF